MDAYAKTAEAYDLIQEARGRSHDEHVAQIRRLAPSATSLLDVACGTGVHLAGFRELFDRVAGVDLSAAMLDRARQRLPDVPLHEGDMRHFKLDETFDVVTCLFSSIGYLLAYTDVRQAIFNMVAHLNPGGVLIIEPWLHPDQWKVPHLVAESANAPGVSVGRVSTNGRYDDISTFTLHWTIATPDGVDYIVEDHELGLYTVDAYRGAMESADLNVEYDPIGLIGRGLFVGRKPS